MSVQEYMQRATDRTEAISRLTHEVEFSICQREHPKSVRKRVHLTNNSGLVMWPSRGNTYMCICTCIYMSVYAY